MKFQRIICLASLCAFGATISGCQTANEHRTATGAVAGTVVGAAAGALIDGDNRGRGALIGAAAGAALGGGIGYVLQKQKESFDRIEGVESRQNTVPVAYQPAPASSSPQAPPPAPIPSAERRDAITLTMKSELLFGVGSSSLTQQGAQKIGEVAGVLNQYPDSRVIVKGYTSSEGTDRDNMSLSQRRADIVKNQLIANRVDQNRIIALGMGSSNPVASNDTEAGRVMNRRVEIDVIPQETTAR